MEHERDEVGRKLQLRDVTRREAQRRQQTETCTLQALRLVRIQETLLLHPRLRRLRCGPAVAVRPELECVATERGKVGNLIARGAGH